jgi:hypothetical protein
MSQDFHGCAIGLAAKDIGHSIYELLFLFDDLVRVSIVQGR